MRVLFVIRKDVDSLTEFFTKSKSVSLLVLLNVCKGRTQPLPHPNDPNDSIRRFLFQFNMNLPPSKRKAPIKANFQHLIRAKMYGVITLNSLEGMMRELNELIPVDLEKGGNKVEYMIRRQH